MDWIRGKKLGHGSFATVNLAAPTSTTSNFPPLMAVKTCGISHSSSLINEKSVLEDLKDCPQVIQCFGESISYENGEQLYNILLEYVDGGSLQDNIKNSGEGRLPEFEVRRYTKALLKGLNHIHKIGYVHCDIKLQNILVDSNGSVKIADFGLTKRAGERKEDCLLRGTPLYMAPEMLAGGEQGTKADIWALGCMVAEMLSGAPAWRCADVATLLMRIGVGEELPEIPERLSTEGKDFLSRCFVKDPTKRWTAEMLLDHPFINGQELFDDCDRKDDRASTSPRCPFDFPEWMSSVICSITYLPSLEYSPESGSSVYEQSRLKTVAAVERVRELVTDLMSPDWSVSGDWITVR